MRVLGSRRQRRAPVHGFGGLAVPVGPAERAPAAAMCRRNHRQAGHRGYVRGTAATRPLPEQPNAIVSSWRVQTMIQ